MSADPSVIRPEEFALIQKVFEDIARETWFYDTEDNLEALASIIVNKYRAGHVTEFDLLETCHDVARERFRR